ncbi:MAG: tetratricopeptide repeat protein [Bacteroidales bacterium]|nr:tetratricopeptide repeat protein [Bacteroidales bacterium]
MKKTLATIVISLLVPLLPAQTMADAERAYQAGNYDEAASAYEQILEQGLESAALYYNLGNTYYRLGQNGRAILNYERALRLKPNDRDTRENLALAESHTTDRIATLPQFFALRWWESLLGALAPTSWRLILLVLLASTAALVVLTLLADQYTKRRNYAIGATGAILLLALCTVVTIASSARLQRHNQAVVTQQAVVVKGSPERDSVDKFIIHEGTKVTIDESLSGWHKIRLADGNTGWLMQADCEII